VRGYFGKVAFCAIIGAGGASRALGDYPDYRDVPYVTVQDFGLFQSLWERAQTQTVRLAMFGDSQETSPGGQGWAYMPRLNYEFFNRYGNVPETEVAYPSSYSTEWLLAGSFAGVKPSQLTRDDTLPGQSVGRFDNSVWWYGQLSMVIGDASNLNPVLGIPVQQYFDPTNAYAQIILGTSPGSDEQIFWRSSVSQSLPHSYYHPIENQGTIALPGLNRPLGDTMSVEIGPLNPTGQPYLETIVRGDGPAGVEMLGVRYKNVANPTGVAIQDFSAGGYRATHLLEWHARSGPILRAFGPYDAIVLHYGANDAGYISAASFHLNVLMLISAIRGPAFLNDPDLPFILVMDPDHAGISEPARLQWDQYAGVLAEIAQGDANVMAINSRRAMEDIGWYVGSPTFNQFVFDAVHYTPYGAQVLAAWEVAAMMGQASGPGSAWLSRGNIRIDGGAPNLDHDAGTPAAPGSPADAHLSVSVASGQVKLGASQTLKAMASDVPGGIDLRGWQVWQCTPQDEASLNAAVAAGHIIDSTARLFTGARVGIASVKDADGTEALLLRLTLVGDVNCDGTVNFTDLRRLSQHYTATGRTWDQGDFNYDGVVNFRDLLALSRSYNLSMPSQASAVPEPHVVCLLWAGFGLLARRRV